MIKCLECGYVTDYLRNNHFKSCPGNYKTVKEYKLKYPNAELTSPEMKKKYGSSENSYIIKHGEIEGKRLWKEYCDRQAYTNTLEYKQNKLGWTKEQFREYNLSRAITLENSILRHGEIEGKRLWKEYCDRQAYTNTLEYFVELLGSFEAGLEKYNEVNRGKAAPHDAEMLSEKLNITIEEALVIISDRKSHVNFTSKGEQLFIQDFEDMIAIDIKYTYKTKQFCIWSQALHIPLFYDACCTLKNKIIEYNGDYWHANPALYSADFYHKHAKMTAKQIWERDSIKIREANDKGFDVFVLWESDYIKDKEGMLLKLKEWYE